MPVPPYPIHGRVMKDGVGFETTVSWAKNTINQGTVPTDVNGYYSITVTDWSENDVIDTTVQNATGTHTISSSVGIGEINLFLYTISLSDIISLSDVVTNDIGVAIDDIISLSESVRQGVTVIFIDVFDTIDTIDTDTNFNKALTDAISINDIPISNKPGKNLTDAISINDIPIMRDVGKLVSDTVVLGDTFVTTTQFSRTLGDNISLVEGLKSDIGIILGDNISLVEGLKSDIGIVVSDNIGVSGISTTGQYLNITDSISIGDTLKTTIGKVVTDSINIGDNGFVLAWGGLFESKKEMFDLYGSETTIEAKD